MEAREYIESGVLELYVYGLLSEAENAEVAKMAREHKDVADEIVAIEQAIINLSTNFSPELGAENFEKTRRKLELRENNAPKPIETARRPNWAAYTGWVAALLLMAGAGYLFTQLNSANTEIVNSATKNKQLNDTIAALNLQNTSARTALAAIRDPKNTIVHLAGQPSTPEAMARIYWNRETQSVIVDASGLPEAPDGQVYQVWAITLKPRFTPTGIGLLEDFGTDRFKIFNLNTIEEADAFGISLEPSGGSQSPTVEQLYVFGKVY